MSLEPFPLAVTARSGAPGSSSGRVASDGSRRRRATGPSVGRTGAGVAAPGAPGSGPVSLDESAWCRWWRDLIVERYRFERFDAFVPLPGECCPWERRVALGRVVEQSMAAVLRPTMTTQLVVEALDAAGFGRVHDLAPDARRVALVRSGWWGDPWPGDDDLRLAVLGTVADALLQEVPPSSTDVDRGGDGSDPGARVSSIVRAAACDAVLAYACHVEQLAARSRTVVRSLQF